MDVSHGELIEGRTGRVGGGMVGERGAHLPCTWVPYQFPAGGAPLGGRFAPYGRRSNGGYPTSTPRRPRTLAGSPPHGPAQAPTLRSHPARGLAYSLHAHSSPSFSNAYTVLSQGLVSVWSKPCRHLVPLHARPTPAADLCLPTALRLSPYRCYCRCCFTGGENGLNQAIELSAETLANVKFVQEKRLISRWAAPAAGCWVLVLPGCGHAVGGCCVCGVCRRSHL